MPPPQRMPPPIARCLLPPPCPTRAGSSDGAGRIGRANERPRLGPLLVVLAIVALLLVVRQVYVPDDFGVQRTATRTAGIDRRASATGGGSPSSTRAERPARSAMRSRSRPSGNAARGHPVRELPRPRDRSSGRPGEAPDRQDPGLVPPVSRQTAVSVKRAGRAQGHRPGDHHPVGECVACHPPHRPHATTDCGRRSLTSATKPVLQTLPPGPGGRRQRACRTRSSTARRCHGYARNHPTDPAKLTIDRTRALCLKCHTDKTPAQRRPHMRDLPRPAPVEPAVPALPTLISRGPR